MPRDAIRPGEVGEGATQPGCGDGSEHILRRFPQVATAPGIYVQRPGEPLRPIKIAVDIEQIWMPGVTYGRGFFMPLSGAAFEAVLRVTLSLEDPPSTTRPALRGSEAGSQGGQRGRPLTAVCCGLSAEVEQTGHQHGILPLRPVP